MNDDYLSIENILARHRKWHKKYKAQQSVSYKRWYFAKHGKPCPYPERYDIGGMR